MIYLLIAIILNTTSAQDELSKKSLANIVMSRGRDIIVYSSGKKTQVDNDMLPITLYPGDEIQVGQDSDCELVFNNSDSMYAGAETLFSVDIYRNSINYIWIKYGTIMHRGDAPLTLKATDITIDPKGGDFLVRYKRSSSEATILNFGPDMTIKQGDDERAVTLGQGKYAKLISFKNRKKVFGNIVQQKIPTLYNTFRIVYTPNDRDVSDFINNVDDSKLTAPPSLHGANIDLFKRTIGF